MKLEISLEEAKRLYEKGIMKEKLEECYPELKEKQFIEEWKNLGNIKGYFITSYSHIRQSENLSSTPDNRNISPSKQLVESQLAEIQLAQILYNYYGENTEDWIDWKDKDQKRYSLRYDWELGDFVIVTTHYAIQQQQLYFKTVKDIRQSIKLHKSLWLQYFGVKE